MVFSSIIFLFIFFPITIITYFIVPNKIKNFVLLIASIFFYAWGEPIYIFLMIFSAVFNYVMGRDIQLRKDSLVNPKSSLVFAVVFNLLILGFFKYYGFLIDTINNIFNSDIAYTKLALPIGISFYTFQALSYIIDVYRGNVPAQKNILKFSVYLTLFPQLIAGPIVKYIDIEEQLDNRKITLSSFGLGTEYFIKGLAKKVLLANTLGMLFTNVTSLNQGDMTTLTAWIGIVAYTLQIYFDFSGYSDMAIGLGKMFGFDFMQNFNYPYISKSVTEFWRRWHISLSTWFREYVYIPLGGNRVSSAKHIRNILVVWFLTGLWHGASWNFIFWGLYYAAFLLFEKYVLTKILDHIPGFIRNIYTMVIVIIGWVFFSLPTLPDAFSYIGIMFGSTDAFLNGTSFYFLRSFGLVLLVGLIVSRPGPYNKFLCLSEKKPRIAVAINCILLILCIAALVYDTYNPFLYFRF